jgi:hypothetical protein
MKERIRGDAYRMTMVCIDSYEQDILVGRMYNPYLQGGTWFCSTMDWLQKMEVLLDRIQMPQSFAEMRSFIPREEFEIHTGSGEEQHVGRLATFAVRVLFRQNASWQGSVQWLEANLEESFRSTTELLFLMNSALHGKTEEQSQG